MGRILGFAGLLIVMAVVVYLYTKQTASTAPEGAASSPRATVDLVGVKNDLIAIANAERRHMASSGSYVSLDELRQAGDINMPTNSRGPYTYAVEVSGSGFRVTAASAGTGGAQPATLSIDETMRIKSE